MSTKYIFKISIFCSIKIITLCIYIYIKLNSVLKQIICDVNMDSYQAKFMKTFVTESFLATRYTPD